MGGERGVSSRVRFADAALEVAALRPFSEVATNAAPRLHKEYSDRSDKKHLQEAHDLPTEFHVAWREPWRAQAIRLSGGPFDRSPMHAVQSVLRNRRRLFKSRAVVEITARHVQCDGEMLAFSAIREVKVVRPRFLGRRITLLVLRKHGGGFQTIGIGPGVDEQELTERLQGAVWAYRHV